MDSEGPSNCRLEQVELPQAARSSSYCALHSRFIAYPDRKQALIHLWNSSTCAITQLAGQHSSPVSALCFSTTEPPLLYSASAEALVEWAVAEGLESLIGNKGVAARSLQASFGCPPQHVQLDESCQQLVVCAGKSARVVACSSGKVVARLEGHEAAVTCAAFLPSRPGVVVTMAEDRRFLAFDVSAGVVLYSSAILCSSSLVSLVTLLPPGAVEALGSRFAVGSADGKVRLFDAAEFRQLLVMDVNEMMGGGEKPWRRQEAASAASGEEDEKVISAVPSWKKAFDSVEELCEDQALQAGVEIECSPLSMRFLSRRREHAARKCVQAGGDQIRLSAAGGDRTSSNEWKAARLNAPSLLIATSHALLEVNLSAMELSSSTLFHSEFQLGRELRARNVPLMSVDFGVAVHAAMDTSERLDPRDVRVVLTSAFTPSTALLHVDLSREEEVASMGGQEGIADPPQAVFSGSGAFVSVFPAGPPLETSFLASRSEDKPSSKAPPMRKRETLEGIKRSSGVTQDQ
eukprot:606306-Hanusia_phi.AAC.1